MLTLEKLRLTGVVKSYNQDNLTSIEEYKNGQLSGTTKYFHSNGELFISIEFKNDPNSPDIGYKDGKYITYDEDGDIEEVRFYRKNIETRARKKISKTPIQNEKIKEHSIPVNRIPDSAKQSYEWTLNPTQQVIVRLGEKYSQKKLNSKIDQNNLFKKWIVVLIPIAITISIISMTINLQKSNIKSNHVKPLTNERNSSSFNISAGDSIINYKKVTKEKTQHVKISNDIKPEHVEQNLDLIPTIDDT